MQDTKKGSHKVAENIQSVSIHLKTQHLEVTLFYFDSEIITCGKLVFIPLLKKGRSCSFNSQNPPKWAYFKHRILKQVLSLCWKVNFESDSAQDSLDDKKLFCMGVLGGTLLTHFF